jgi:hypothetical protein
MKKTLTILKYIKERLRTLTYEVLKGIVLRKCYICYLVPLFESLEVSAPLLFFYFIFFN